MAREPPPASSTSSLASACSASMGPNKRAQAFRQQPGKVGSRCYKFICWGVACAAITASRQHNERASSAAACPCPLAPPSAPCRRLARNWPRAINIGFCTSPWCKIGIDHCLTGRTAPTLEKYGHGSKRWSQLRLRPAPAPRPAPPRRWVDNARGRCASCRRSQPRRAPLRNDRAPCDSGEVG